ncbi:MAG TPA: cysteine desulfurase family protein [Candidatus Eisenbacteria bacterium]|nr:cysteine desulfurase family protein [Candidatus Eisenbacteria bacterium]
MRIYLDHNASAPLRPEVRAAMIDALGATGNPSSAHREGAHARMLVERARAEVAALVGGEPSEVIFTSGATEANNLALRGTLAASGRRGLVTTAIEHASVLETARELAAGGAPLAVVGVDAEGHVAVADVTAACTADTALVSVGLANGEVGSVAPVAAIAAGLAGRGLVVHTDAAQAAGRLPIDTGGLGVDLLSLSAHKLGGPTGVGALWARRGCALRAQSTGGSQERRRRAGTENVAGIVGFGVAAQLARAELAAAGSRMAALRDRLWEGLRAALPDIVRNGPAGEPRLPNTLNVTVPRCEGESLLVLLDLEGVAASLGSACAAGGAEPSHVLRAMGRSEAEARSGLRLSLGPATTDAEIDRVVAVVPRLVAQIRRGAAA